MVVFSGHRQLRTEELIGSGGHQRDVVLLGAALIALAHQAHWTTATAAEWVAYAGLNAIGLGVILHVAIGRRWPFATKSETLV